MEKAVDFVRKEQAKRKVTFAIKSLTYIVRNIQIWMRYSMKLFFLCNLIHPRNGKGLLVHLKGVGKTSVCNFLEVNAYIDLMLLNWTNMEMNM